MRHYSKIPATTEIMLLANIADSLNFIAWSKTKDAEKGRNRPESIVASLYGTEKKDDITSFATPEDYEEARRKLIKKIGV